MPACTYYRVETNTIRSREIRPDRQAAAPTVIRVPWCAHPESLVERRIAISVLGGSSLLHCCGDLERCQVPGAKAA